MSKFISNMTLLTVALALPVAMVCIFGVVTGVGLLVAAGIAIATQ
jgi:hypothetical protein